jgi:hypothetical protein
MIAFPRPPVGSIHDHSPKRGIGLAAILNLLRIQIVRRPPVANIDGIRLDVFEPGSRHEVGNLLGAVLLAEGWATCVADERPPPLAVPDRPPAPPAEPKNGSSESDAPSNLVRETTPRLWEHLGAGNDLEPRSTPRR